MKKLLKKHFSFIIAVLMVISLIIIPRTAQAASVKLNKTKLTMNVGGVYHLKVSGTNKKVTWSSTDSKVASVSSGKVKAKKTGTATITAKIGSKKLKCQIKIKDQRALYEKVLLQSGGKCFYLMDIDRNGTPDLIVSSNRGVIVDYSVYTIKNGKVIYAGQCSGKGMTYQFLQYNTHYNGIHISWWTNGVGGSGSALWTLSGSKLVSTSRAYCSVAGFQTGKDEQHMKNVSQASFNSYCDKHFRNCKQYTMWSNTSENRIKHLK